jgi:hypothetical protein
VDLANEPVGERESLAEPPEPMVHGRDVVRDFCHIIQRHTGSLFQLEEEEIRERGLRALDLRGQDGLLADIAVEEEAGIGKERGEVVEAAEGQERLLQQELQFPVQPQGWIWGTLIQVWITRSWLIKR